MILIPAAGEGRRFREAGYSEPKHLIPLLGVPMVDRVVSNIRPLDPDGHCLLATQALVGKTRGAVETILRATTLFEGYREAQFSVHDRLVVANCDQLLLIPDLPLLWGNGVIFTFKSANPAHSYVQVDHKGLIRDIIEKPAEPDPTWQAVSGVYAFTQGLPFLDACATIYQAGGEGEQYVSSALKVMIEDGYQLYAEQVPTAILGTPEDFQRFETAAAVARSLA